MLIETWLVIHLAAPLCNQENIGEDIDCGTIVGVYGGSTQCLKAMERADEWAGKEISDVYCITLKPNEKVPM